MADTGHDNWNGYTSTTSEGAWSRVDSGLMKYERSSPQTYGSPTSQAYRDGWERIFGQKTCPHCTLPIRRGQTVTVDGTAHSGCAAGEQAPSFSDILAATCEKRLKDAPDPREAHGRIREGLSAICDAVADGECHSQIRAVPLEGDWVRVESVDRVLAARFSLAAWKRLESQGETAVRAFFGATND